MYRAESELEVDKSVCRLCLKNKDCVVDLFEEQLVFNKSSLAEVLSEFFHITYEKTSNLPNGVCQHCFDIMESFTIFIQNVKDCESKLRKRDQSHKQSSGYAKAYHVEMLRSGLNGCPGTFDPEGNCTITVVDPLQEYESSDDDFSMDSGAEMEDSSEKKKPYSTAKETATKIETHAIELNSADSRAEVNNVTVSGTENLPMEVTKNTFLCQFCDIAFITHQDCLNHETQHDAVNPFNCKFCALNTYSRQSLIYHIKEMHDSERPYICVICNKGFCRRSDLKKHTIVHTGVRPFTCRVCAKSFSRNTNLTKHMRIHSGIKPHVCQKCPRSFTTAAELTRHARSHSQVKPYQCDKCPSSFTRRDKLLLHKQTHNRKQTELSQSNVNTLMVIKDQSSQSVFKQSHPNQYSACKQISYATNTSDQSQGIASQQSSGIDDIYKNSILATQLERSDKFKVLTKTNTRSIACDICDKMFARERDLQRHQALHLDKLFTCKECSCSFNRREKLLRHEQEQHRPKYTCSLCPIVFSTREALIMHMKVHELQQNEMQTLLVNVNSESTIDANAAGIENLPLNKSVIISDITFYNQMAPTMNLGFYSEIKPEDRSQ